MINKYKYCQGKETLQFLIYPFKYVKETLDKNIICCKVLPGTFRVKEQDEIDRLVVFPLQSQHIIWRNRDWNAIVKVTSFWHFGINYLQSEQIIVMITIYMFCYIENYGMVT